MLFGEPVVRQELFNTLCGMRHDTAEYILQIFLGVDSKVSTGMYQ